MKFQYYENDPMDEVPAPPVEMALSLAGITALFLAILYGTAFILGYGSAIKKKEREKFG